MDVFQRRSQLVLLCLAGPFLCSLLATGCARKPIVPYTTDSVPQVLIPIHRAGIEDDRGRFREIACAVLEAHGRDLPRYRSCQDALVTVGEEPPPTGDVVALGPAQRRLVALFVPGVGWECIENWMRYQNEFDEHISRFGYDSVIVRVDGLSSSENNARQLRDAILAQREVIEPRSLVLIGYSKGAPDILTAVVEYPEIRPYIAAVVSVAGAIGGSPLAYQATQKQLEMLRFAPDAECSQGDGGALESLLPSTRQLWLARNELPDEFPYYSVVTYPLPERISSVLKGTHARLSRIDPRNDSQVIFYDQLIPGSTLLGYLNADHWAAAVPVSDQHPFYGRWFVDQNDYPREAMAEALMRYVEEDLARRDRDR